MKRDEAEQIARIIYNVFEHEEQVDPRTIAKMFQYMGRINPLDMAISYYYCGHCNENISFSMECPCCGLKDESECKHQSQTPHLDNGVHMCIKCNEEFCK